MRKIASLLMIQISFCTALSAQPPTESEWLWPYASDSIWNMPIHTDSEYYFIGDNFYHHNKYVDDVFFAKINVDDPIRAVRQNNCGGWGNKCEDCGAHPNLPAMIRFPDMEIGCGTANNTFCFSFPDGKWILSQAMGRSETNGKLFIRSWTKFQNINVRGHGLERGGHGATSLSALGGTIRLGELISDHDIRHSLKVTAWALEYCYRSSHRWPAHNSDGYSSDYRGFRPKLKIGALLALHQDADLDAMGFETVVGKKLAKAMKYYGAYFVEDSHDWGAGAGAWGWVLEYGVQEETEAQYGIKMRGAGSDTPYFRDIDRITSNLYVIDNNSMQSIGGGPNAETKYPEQRLQPLLSPCGSENRNMKKEQQTDPEIDKHKAHSFILYQNYPNPFNPATNIRYYIETSSHVLLQIYDLSGNLTETLVNEVQDAGTYTLTFLNEESQSGTYLYKLTAGNSSAVGKMLLLR